jgi:uncharacterized protein YfaS (alpha-2-macroglobulin family)
MRAQQGNANRWRRWVALSLAAGIGTVMLTLPWRTSGQDGGKPFQPRVLAVFESDSSLIVSVSVNPDKNLAKTPGRLSLDLIGDKGFPLAGRGNVIGGKFPDRAENSMQLSVFKNRTKGTRLRVTYRGDQFEVPLDQVLLLKGHETAFSCGADFYAGSQSPFHCTVHAIRSLTETIPLPNCEVMVSMSSPYGANHIMLAHSRTDANGRADLQMTIPNVPPGEYDLRVLTISALGRDTIQRKFKVKSDAKILLTSDKPMYRPGDLMHLRALVLRADMKPIANKEMLFEIADLRGNKVFKKTLNTSEFGIAAVDFQLADEVNMGDYQVRAILGELRADKTLTVKNYVLPRFKLTARADKSFYLPREKMTLDVQSDYFFGKPVRKARVEVVASTSDVAYREFHKWTGSTDENGHVKLDIQLPDYFVGQPLLQGKGMVKLEVGVRDNAEHVQSVTKTYPVSDQPMQISLIAEGGRLAAGLENRIFAAAVYPDGTPAAGCDVAFWLGKEGRGAPFFAGKTNSAGLAEFRITPKIEQLRANGIAVQEIEMKGGKPFVQMPQLVLDIHAQLKDARGNKAASTLTLNSQPLGDNVLLRLDKAIYQLGDSMNINVRSSARQPIVYIEVIRAGQVMLRRWYDLKDGQVNQKLDLPQDMFGSMEIHAYQVLSDGVIIRDSRVVYVQPRDELKIAVHQDKEEYLPGADGKLKFIVTDARGNAAQAALGLVIVDEAVYAMQEMQPGLEKVYFTLQQELLKPKVDFKFNPGEGLDNLILQPAKALAAADRQQVAEVLLTAVKLPAVPLWEINPGLERQQRLGQQLVNIGSGIFQFVGHHQAPFQEFDANAKKWVWRPNLLEETVKAGLLDAKQLDSPWGGKITLADLSKLDKGFTVDNLALACTANRIQQLAGAIASYANLHKDRFFKNDRWELPQTLLTEIVEKQRYEAGLLKDAWGEPLRLVKRDKKIDHPLFGPAFAEYEIVSAGPDRVPATADDVGFVQAQKMFGWVPFADRVSRFPPAMAKEKAKNDPGQVKDVPADKGSAAPITRVRAYFPETMLWQPALITDDKGIAQLSVNFAGNITTWRLGASANSRGGALGGTSVPLKVFQDFFVDIDLPLHVTQNDEISFPVAVSNYLKTPQTVKIEFQSEPWFELMDANGLTRQLDLKPNEVTAVRYRIKANKLGSQPLSIKAHGSKRSDAVRRFVEVAPNGQKYERAITERLAGKGAAQQSIDIPANAVPDASRIMVRVYPGVMPQLVEGLEGMLRAPNGCFEQTSSSAYPNILIIDYLRKNKISSPKLMMESERLLNLGHQRLLTFERPGGGFDWWGRDPALVWLSAYGLQEFSDMARVYPIDRGIIDRTQNFLLSRMDQQEGTWDDIGATHAETLAGMGSAKMLLSSHVVWSLLDSGMDRDRAKKSIDWIRANVKNAEGNAYILALTANALAAYDARDKSTLDVLRKLEKLHKDLPEWKAISFPANTTSLTYARGDFVTVESTALTALAMARTGQFTDQVNKSLTYLIKAKHADGTWGTTSATILSLKALLAGMPARQVKGTIPFTILVDGKQAARGTVSPQNFDVMQTFDLKAFTHTGKNLVEIQVAGEASLTYQIVARHYEPWKTGVKAAQSVIDINVEYDRTKLSTTDVLKAKAALKYNGKVPTYNVIVELGLPPGFKVDAGDFAQMVGKSIKKFSLTQRQAILYIGDVKPGDVLHFEYTLKPTHPVKVRTPPSTAYEYYTPSIRSGSLPVELEVVLADEKR